MKRPNITPGPWKDGKSQDGRISVWTLPGYYNVFDGSHTEQKAEANARAIAAVPALLEALEHAFERINSAINSGHCMKYADAVAGQAGACIEDYDKIRSALIAAGYQF